MASKKINSRAKGKRGELELCKAFKEVLGLDARRTAQFCGHAGDSDVIVEQANELFVECKLVESLSLVPVMRKAVEQCKGKLPIICHRKKHTEFLVTMRLSDLTAISKVVCRSASRTRQESESTLPNTGAVI